MTITAMALDTAMTGRYNWDYYYDYEDNTTLKTTTTTDYGDNHQDHYHYDYGEAYEDSNYY